MPELLQIQSWLDSLGAAYTIQRLRNGEVLFSLTQGTMNVTVVRPTFAEAAEVCILNSSTTGTKHNR